MASSMFVALLTHWQLTWHTAVSPNFCWSWSRMSRTYVRLSACIRLYCTPSWNRRQKPLIRNRKSLRVWHFLLPLWTSWMAWNLNWQTLPQGNNWWVIDRFQYSWLRDLAASFWQPLDSSCFKSNKILVLGFLMFDVTWYLQASYAFIVGVVQRLLLLFRAYYAFFHAHAV